MTELDILNRDYPIRRSEKQKEAFRKYVASTCTDVREETTHDGKNCNIVIGDPTSAKITLTAHYDTPPRSIFPNIMMPRNRVLYYTVQMLFVFMIVAVAMIPAILIADMAEDRGLSMAIFLIIYYSVYFLGMKTFDNPYNYNDNSSGIALVLTLAKKYGASDKVAFILFDNEEKGMKGSKAYYKDHKDAMAERLIINFDCIGNGNNIILIANKALYDGKDLAEVRGAFPTSENFTVYACTHKEGDANSDHKSFPRGIGCVAAKRTSHGLLYTPNIHTPRDREVHAENIEYIESGISTYLESL